MEDDVAAEEGGVDVDACAAETKNVRVDVDLEVGVLVGAVGHVVAVWPVAGVGVVCLVLGEELWGRGEYLVGVEWAEGGMEGC